MILRISVTAFCLWQMLLCNTVTAEAKQQIAIVYFSQEKIAPPALSNLDPFIKEKGHSGAELAVQDNNTTGQFTGQAYKLDKLIVAPGADINQIFQDKIKNRYRFIIANLPANQLNQIVPLIKDSKTLLFDAGTTDDQLRQTCAKNVLFILPSRAMRADALAQYMMKKRWNKWFLVTGPAPQDQLYTAAIKRSAKRFGMKIIAEKKWNHTYDARRTAQSDVPVFTQVDDYDVLVVADEQGLFGEYLDYRSWLPRPVIGTQGLVATAWHRTHEQWGAVQIQNRFKELAGRWMEEEDYGAYLAVRAIGEAATRSQSDQFEPIYSYLMSEKFALQGYKGKPLSFRAWNGQLRQPVLLAAPKSMVTVAPIEGFLHPKTELDTLGFDQPESLCK